jgi:hypothetical protein
MTTFRFAHSDEDALRLQALAGKSLADAFLTRRWRHKVVCAWHALQLAYRVAAWRRR